MIYFCTISDFQDVSISLTEENQTSAATAEAAAPDKAPTAETKDEEGVRLNCMGLMYSDSLIYLL